MYWIVGIIGVVFFVYWQMCRATQVTLFDHQPYERGWLVYVAVGRGYGRLTPSKVQALRNEGLQVFQPRTSGAYPQVIVPAYSLSDMVIKAADLGQRHHLMLLW